MPALTAAYLNDGLGRTEITASGLQADVSYSLQRRTAFEPTWVDVRGGQEITGATTVVVYDYEYTPNMLNEYQLLTPVFYEAFTGQFPLAGALAVDGIAGNYASTPDDASLDIVGDLDIRFEIDLPDWSLNRQVVIAKWEHTGGQRSYMVTLEANGIVRLWWSTDGMVEIFRASTVAIPIQSGRLAIGVTLDVNNGAAGHTASFYTAPYIGGTFTQLGASVVTAGVTSIFASTAALEIGSRNGGALNVLTGNVFAAQVRNGILGVLVANPDFTAQSAGTLNFVDSTGKTWTVQGNAEIIETFRAIGTSWGTANTGQTWFVGGTAPGLNAYVTGGVGVTEDLDTASASYIEQFVTTDATSADMEMTYSLIQPTTVDVDTEYNMSLRASDFNNHYESRVVFGADGTLSMQISKTLAGVNTDFTDLTPVGQWEPNEEWNFRFRVVDDDLSFRGWQASDNEPGGWNLIAEDPAPLAGMGVYMRSSKDGGDPVTQWYGPIEVHSVPELIGGTASVTPDQDDVFLKSVQYPSLNRALECVNWDALSRSSRVGLFDIKGRHEILAITDVGSSASFNLTFTTRTKAENRAVVALLTYGGTLLLQPPGDDDSIPCQSEGYSGTPAGFVVPGNSVQAHALPGQPIWTWTVGFTKVAAPDPESIIPTTLTWQQLWDIIGPEGTWEDVWATWPTWQALWSEVGSSESFFQN